MKINKLNEMNTSFKNILVITNTRDDLGSHVAYINDIEDIKNLRQKEIKEPWNKGKKIDNKKSKQVFQYTLDNTFIKEWNSVKEAENEFGKGIGNCARGKSKTSNGYIWRYTKD